MTDKPAEWMVKAVLGLGVRDPQAVSASAAIIARHHQEGCLTFIHNRTLKDCAEWNVKLEQAVQELLAAAKAVVIGSGSATIPAHPDSRLEAAIAKVEELTK